MIAQQWGRMPSVRTTGNLTLPAYERLAMQGGIIADGLGTGKTIMCLSFILFTTMYPGHTIRGPTLVLAPSALILYAWMDEVEKNWPGLKGYLYHGRHDGQIGKDYENRRILAEDIEMENGEISTVDNKWHFLFDYDQRDSQKSASLLSSQRTSRSPRARKSKRGMTMMTLSSPMPFLSLWYLYCRRRPCLAQPPALSAGRFVRLSRGSPSGS
jgi:hypothetical protein